MNNESKSLDDDLSAPLYEKFLINGKVFCLLTRVGLAYLRKLADLEKTEKYLSDHLKGLRWQAQEVVRLRNSATTSPELNQAEKLFSKISLMADLLWKNYRYLCLNISQKVAP